MAGTAGTTGGRVEEQSALVAILDGTVERMLRSPLMRRAPAQCSAEEQIEQAALLGDLVQLRALREHLEKLSGPRLDHVAAYWPELAALLVPPRRQASGKARQGTGPAPSATLGGLYENVVQEPGDTPPSVGSDSPELPDTPVAPLPDGDAKTSTAPDLAHLLLEALTVQGRALNTTQMLAWLHERGAGVTREDVMNTLFGHEELFKRRGAGHWVVAGREA